jgi:type VI secretion system secreted protein Hcp
MYDAFLKIEGPPLTGESSDDKHKGEIEIFDFAFNAKHAQTMGSGTGGSGAGRVALSGFRFSKRTDTTSPLLFQHCAAGTHFDKMTVCLRRAGKTQQEYLKYTFGTTFIESVECGGLKGEDITTETITFAYGRIGIDYAPQKADGNLGAAIHGGWDALANKKF